MTRLHPNNENLVSDDTGKYSNSVLVLLLAGTIRLAFVADSGIGVMSCQMSTRSQRHIVD